LRIGGARKGCGRAQACRKRGCAPPTTDGHMSPTVYCYVIKFTFHNILRQGLFARKENVHANMRAEACLGKQRLFAKQRRQYKTEPGSMDATFATWQTDLSASQLTGLHRARNWR
jgi:hypothetical protein